MDILSQLNAAIDYIEKNLTSKIDYDEVARICCCSSYNFHRMFSFITGISVTEYVRNRRMTLAAFELQAGGRKVIDIALKYGYDSPVSFSRAFRAVHHASPSEVKAGSAILKAYPKLTVQFYIKGVFEMNYRVEEKPGFKAFGVEKAIACGGDGMQIPDFFTECINNGKFGDISRLGKSSYSYDKQPTMSGIGNCRNHNGENYSYMVGWLVFDGRPLPCGYSTIDIPACTWAVFETKRYKDGCGDVDVIQELWKRIFQEWLPASEYELADVPQIEQDYYENPDACYAEIWIPVRKKG